MKRPAAGWQVFAILPLLILMDVPAQAAFDVALPYPTEVALSQEGDKGYVFRRFPGSQRLYTYDLDRAGHSSCNAGCEGAHPPVLAPASAKPMGEWTTIRRYDDRLQWAYRGHPVYSFFHDAPANPLGDGDEGGVWHLLPYEK
jgi:predicted lipoprotein with Yx(FWY)xxD motif